MWSYSYDGPANKYDALLGVAVDDGNNFVITGTEGVASGHILRVEKYDGGCPVSSVTQSQVDTAVLERIVINDVIVAPNVLDLSVPTAKVSICLKGKALGHCTVRIYDSAGRYMGKYSLDLDSDGLGAVDYGREGFEGYLPGPGAYWALIEGSGVNIKKLFFVVGKQ
jgi:hypothetical protein